MPVSASFGEDASHKGNQAFAPAQVNFVYLAQEADCIESCAEFAGACAEGARMLLWQRAATESQACV